MNVNDFIQIINGVGFPIACVIGLALYIVWDKKTMQKTLLQLTDAVKDLSNLKEGYAELRASMDNLNLLIRKITKEDSLDD